MLVTNCCLKALIDFTLLQRALLLHLLQASDLLQMFSKIVNRLAVSFLCDYVLLGGVRGQKIFAAYTHCCLKKVESQVWVVVPHPHYG